METKKYGLQLRVPSSQQRKHPARPSVRTPLGFNEEGSDDVEREISRQANKNKALKDYEEQHKKALEEDPTIFDYDAVYDEMKVNAIRPRAQDREERKPKYIQQLLEKAKVRQREQEIIYERKLAKERTKDEHLYADKDKFVTSAYKKKLAEQAKWMEEERLRQLREEKEDVTKKSDLTDFYFNLGKNVAFGKGIDLKRPEKQSEPIKSENNAELGNPAKDEENTAFGTSDKGFSSINSSLKEGQKGETSTILSEFLNAEPTPEKPAADVSVKQEPLIAQQSTVQPKRDHHKRNEDALAAAKERFLARKKSKEQ